MPNKSDSQNSDAVPAVLPKDLLQKIVATRGGPVDAKAIIRKGSEKSPT